MNRTMVQVELFGLIWRRPEYPFRLRVNDVIRVNGRLGRVIRVTESAAVFVMNQPLRQFKTRFDKPVRFQPPPRLGRMSANAEVEILNRPSHNKPKGRLWRPSRKEKHT